MSGGQIAALIVAVLLLLPGGCFLLLGMLFSADRQYRGAALLFLPIALAILASAGVLFWVALRRRRPKASGRQR